MSKWFKIRLEAAVETYVMVEDNEDWLDAAEKAEDDLNGGKGIIHHQSDFSSFSEEEVPYDQVPANFRA